MLTGFLRHCIIQKLQKNIHGSPLYNRMFGAVSLPAVSFCCLHIVKNPFHDIIYNTGFHFFIWFLTIFFYLKDIVKSIIQKKKVLVIWVYFYLFKKNAVCYISRWRLVVLKNRKEHVKWGNNTGY